MASGEVVAVDMGGTRMRCAAVHAGDTMGAVVETPTLRQRPSGAILDDLAALIEQARKPLPRCEGVALGIPTVLDAQGGLAACDNLPTMTGVPIQAELETRTGLTVRVHNDATCFAVGEWWKGAGSGCRNVCGVTLGTGIGLGLVLDNRPYTGSRGAAGEIWRTSYPDGATVEARCSGAFITETYARRTGQNLQGEAIAQRAHKGDPAALETFDEYGRSLGGVLAFVLDLLDPDIAVLGGSVSKSFPYFQKSLLEQLNRPACDGNTPRVVASALGEAAALWGAAKLFRDGKG
jgi:glucokinase